MVEDAELPFPESVAAAEIHKAGQGGSGGSKYLFWAMGLGAAVKLLGELKFFLYLWEKFVFWGKQTISGTVFTGKGGMMLSSPGVSPAYMGVGYIIGPKLGALNFSGGLLAWGLMVPMIMYFILPGMDFQAWASFLMSKDATLTLEQAMTKVNDPAYQMLQIWKFIVRPIAIGGMLVSAAFTLYKMRKSLITGVGRSITDVKKAAQGMGQSAPRTEKDLSFGAIIVGILAVAVLTFSITYFIFQTNLLIAIVASTVMIILAFFFAAVSGYLVGIMGSSNNPISGLTLTALVVTALILVGLGVQGNAGVATVLGVAAIVCVSAAVAGEMLQDLKAGHILGGTPWRMQIGDIIGVILAGAVMFVVLAYLNEGDIASGKNLGYQGGFGSRNLSAPQAGLMAILSRGIVEGAMAWPLIISGMLMGVAFILMQVRSPMLVSVGMYLPLETTFAIFVGGLIKGGVDYFTGKRKLNEAQKIRVENTGVLLASGMIAGEALMGLVIAIFAAFEIFLYDHFVFFRNPNYFISLVIIAIIAFVLIQIPLKNAGKPDEPAPPASGM